MTRYDSLNERSAIAYQALESRHRDRTIKRGPGFRWWPRVKPLKHVFAPCQCERLGRECDHWRWALQPGTNHHDLEAHRLPHETPADVARYVVSRDRQATIEQRRRERRRVDAMKREIEADLICRDKRFFGKTFASLPRKLRKGEEGLWT